MISALPNHFERADGDAIGLRTSTAPAVMEAIADSYICPSDLSYSEISRLVRNTVRDASKTGLNQLDEFQAILDQHTAEWYQNPPQLYSLWSRLNFKPAKPTRLRLKQHDIYVCRNVPKRLLKNWTDPNVENPNIVKDIDGGVVLVTGKFRSLDSAGFKLGQILNEFVGLLNFEFSRKVALIVPEERRALFKVGPTEYVQMPDGTYPKSVWTNPRYDSDSFEGGRDKDKHFAAGLRLIRAIQTGSKRNALTDPIIRCAGILDDFYTASLNTEKLILVWACFEQIFSTQSDGSRGTYETIAKRAARFDVNENVRETILLTLASRRNQAAHSLEATGSCHEAQEVASECASFMTWLLGWLISQGSQFSSKQEFLDWVDIPKEKERLLRRLRLHNLAVSYWHPRKAEAAPAADG